MQETTLVQAVSVSRRALPNRADYGVLLVRGRQFLSEICPFAVRRLE